MNTTAEAICNKGLKDPAGNAGVSLGQQEVPAHELLENTSREIPRPALTLREAAAVLGKSLRTIERSLLGKWGNKLPDGWSGKRIKTDSGLEWRIIPPPGFRLRQFNVEDSDADCSAVESDESQWTAFRSLPQTIDHPTIIIDRSDEVERLLRELLATQKQLLEERRLRMEDLRLLNQANNSMRLLEDRAGQTAKLKEDLETASLELRHLKSNYLELLALPWWKRIFYKVRGKA